MKDHPHPERFGEKTALNNYRLITSLPMVWKILTVEIYSLITRGFSPEEQKGFHKRIKKNSKVTIY